jgi:hypothetical protein
MSPSAGIVSKYLVRSIAPYLLLADDYNSRYAWQLVNHGPEMLP